jgi:hypothetical protein
MEHDPEFMSGREAARSLGLRMGTLYQLLWDGIVTGQKDDTGKWMVNRMSVEHYRIRRNFRRASPYDVIDLVPQPASMLAAAHET